MKESRREFLRKMLAVSVLSATCPHILLGKIEPQILKDGDKILGRFYIDINKYPSLRDLWQSVRIKIPPEMTYGFFAPIMITKVDPFEFGIDYSCLYTLCPHEGREVFDFDPTYQLFKCSGHGSLFLADGTYFAGPAAKDLTTYHVNWDGADTLWMDIPAVISGIDDEESSLSYMNECEPNPCTDTAQISYGIEKGGMLDIRIYDIRGSEVLRLFNGMQTQGHHDLLIDVTTLLPGAYLCTMKFGKATTITRKIIVKR